MVLGGTHAGLSYKSPAPYLRLPELRAVPDFKRPGMDTVTASIAINEYRHYDLHINKDLAFGFWIPTHVKCADADTYVMRKLVEGFRRPSLLREE
jgi:hypothetical protein